MITNNHNYQLLHRMGKREGWKQDIQHIQSRRGLDPIISMQESSQKDQKNYRIFDLCGRIHSAQHTLETLFDCPIDIIG